MKTIATIFHDESTAPLTFDVGFDGIGVPVARMVDAGEAELLSLLINCVVAGVAVVGEVTFIALKLEVMVRVTVLFIRKAGGDVEKGIWVG